MTKKKVFVDNIVILLMESNLYLQIQEAYSLDISRHPCFLSSFFLFNINLKNGEKEMCL